MSCSSMVACGAGRTTEAPSSYCGIGVKGMVATPPGVANGRRLPITSATSTDSMPTLSFTVASGPALHITPTRPGPIERWRTSE
jgi:hypothetical protein